jgi:hypothetical protein
LKLDLEKPLKEINMLTYKSNLGFITKLDIEWETTFSFGGK